MPLPYTLPFTAGCTAALASHGLLTATALATKFVLTAALSGHGTLAALAEAEFTRLPALTATGVLAATDKPNLPAALTSHGALTTTATAKSARPATLFGRGVLTALIQIGDHRDATLSSHGALTATATALDVSTISGQLAIVCTNSYYNLQSEDPYDLGDGSAYVECTQTPNLSDGSTQALFYVYGPPAPGSGYIVAIGYYGGNFVCQDNGGSSTTMITRNGTVPFDPAVHKWWRIRESGGTVYWDYGPDSLNWTNGASRSISGVNALYVGFNSGCGPTAPAPGSAIWDNFNISSVPAALSSFGTLTATASQRMYPVASAVLSSHGALTASLATQSRLHSQGALTASLATQSGLHSQGTLSASTTAKCPVAAAPPSHGALTATATRFAFAGQLRSHGTVAAAATAKSPTAVAAASHGALAATAQATKFVLTAALPAHGALTTSASQATRPAVPLSAHGALTATVTGNVQPTPSGHGVLAASAHATKFVLTTALSGHGALTAATEQILPASAALHNQGTLSATATPFIRPATLAGHGALTATTAGPKINTVCDNFKVQDTKWTGWTVPGPELSDGPYKLEPSSITIGVQASPNLPSRGTLTAVTKIAPPPMVIVAVKPRCNTFLVPRGLSRVTY